MPANDSAESTSPVAEIDHIGVQVPNLAAAIDFFTGTLGFELVHRGFGPDGTTPVAFVRLGGVLFEVFEQGEGEARLEHIALRSDDDVAGVAEALVARGLRPTGGAVEIVPGLRGTRAVLFERDSTLGVRMHLNTAASDASRD